MKFGMPIYDIIGTSFHAGMRIGFENMSLLFRNKQIFRNVQIKD